MTKPASVGGKIQHLQILRASIHCAGLINIYREQVLSQQTRTIRLLGRKNPAKIIHTLLGFEVQASYKRIQCPDMVTARYLRLFSELGCHSIKLPYDPTLTEKLIPELEAMIEGIQEEIHRSFAQDLPTQRYVTRNIFGILRQQLAIA
jgi:hypothetical protein